MTPAPIIDNTQARIDRLEQRIGSLHVSDGVIGWDGYDDLPVAALPVEAANKNIKRILRKMVETSRVWSEKLPFALWAYRTSFRTSTGSTPYSLVYGMEALLPIEIEMGSLRVALEHQISETEWVQSRYD